MNSHRLSQKEKFSSRSSSLLCVLLLIAVTAGIFGRAVSFDFLAWDDGDHIYANALINPATPQSTLQFWAVPFRARPATRIGKDTPPYQQLYAPLTFSLYAALSHVARLTVPAKTPSEGFSPLNPAVFHAANLLVHLANVLLVFALLRLLGSNNGAALLGALLFAVHPVQVEAVAWVTQLNTLLSGFFSLLTLNFWLLFWRQRAQNRSGTAFYGAATLCFLLALLSKPLAVVVPPLAVILAMWRYRVSLRASLAWTFPWWGAAAVIIVINRSLQPESDAALSIALWKRPFQAGDALAFYGAKVLFPLRQMAEYTRTSAFVLSHWWGYLTWIFPVGIGLAAWRGRARFPALWIGFWFFVVGVLPTIGFVPYYFHWYSTVADRYLYLAMAGAALALAGLWIALERAPQARRLAAQIFLVALVPLWCFQSGRDLGNWRNTALLWEHNMALNSRSWLAANNLANYYSLLGRDEEAMALYGHSIVLNASNSDANYNLGLLLDKKGRSAEAIARFKLAAASSPRDAEIWNSLAVAYARQNQMRQAGECWQRALSLDDDYAEAHINYGVALAMQGRDAEASVQWNRALQLQPDNAELHFNLGVALKKRGQISQAAARWRETLRLQPDHQGASRELLQLKP